MFCASLETFLTSPVVFTSIFCLIKLYKHTKIDCVQVIFLNYILTINHKKSPSYLKSFFRFCNLFILMLLFCSRFFFTRFFYLFFGSSIFLLLCSSCSFFFIFGYSTFCTFFMSALSFTFGFAFCFTLFAALFTFFAATAFRSITSFH